MIKEIYVAVHIVTRRMIYKLDLQISGCANKISDAKHFHTFKRFAMLGKGVYAMLGKGVYYAW